MLVKRERSAAAQGMSTFTNPSAPPQAVPENMVIGKDDFTRETSKEFSRKATKKEKGERKGHPHVDLEGNRRLNAISLFHLVMLLPDGLSITCRL